MNYEQWTTEELLKLLELIDNKIKREKEKYIIRQELKKRGALNIEESYIKD